MLLGSTVPALCVSKIAQICGVLHLSQQMPRRAPTTKIRPFQLEFPKMQKFYLAVLCVVKRRDNLKPVDNATYGSIDVLSVVQLFAITQKRTHHV